MLLIFVESRHADEPTGSSHEPLWCRCSKASKASSAEPRRTCDSAGCKTISKDRLCASAVPPSSPLSLPPFGSCAGSLVCQLPFERGISGTATPLIMLLQPPPLAPVAKLFGLACPAAGIPADGGFPAAASADSVIIEGPLQGEPPVVEGVGDDFPCKG